jgi:hypothetical protein
MGFNTIKKRYIILNSELAIDDSPHIMNEVKQVFNRGYNKVLLQSQVANLKNFRLVEGLVNLRSTFSEFSKTGAKYQKIVKADGKEPFFRLSAYEDDKRIDFLNKKLIKGSYATTILDYLLCKAGDDNPVERYALPNDEEIKFKFKIIPTINDDLQRGKVEPAFGHVGGGAEVLFEHGTSNNTFIEKTIY